MYSISEVAKIIGVSRQSIYKKLDNPELQKHLQDSDKGKVLTEKGLKVLKELFKEYLDSKPLTDNEPTPNSEKVDNLQGDYTIDYIASLKAEIESLKGIVEQQGLQLINMTKLIENSQVLQKQQQDKIFLLESPQDMPVKEKSIWSIFKRK